MAQISITEKLCRNCDTIKPISEFSKKRGNVSKPARHCWDCRRVRYAKRQSEDSQSERSQAVRFKAYLRRRYGITIEQYETILRNQRGVCAICLRANRNDIKLAIDHDHVTGHVRGLLCIPCNTMLGWLSDSPVLLRRAVKYLRAAADSADASPKDTEPQTLASSLPTQMAML